MNPHAERDWRIREARKALAKANGAIADPPLDSELAFAVLETAIALTHLAGADFNQRALRIVEAHLGAARDALGGGRSTESPPEDKP